MATKTAAKKTAASKKSDSVEVEMYLARTTKNTYRFETDEDGAAVNPLYVQQSAFPNGAPENITISITAS